MFELALQIKPCPAVPDICVSQVTLSIETNHFGLPSIHRQPLHLAVSRQVIQHGLQTCLRLGHEAQVICTKHVEDTAGLAMQANAIHQAGHMPVRITDKQREEERAQRTTLTVSHLSLGALQLSVSSH